MYISHTSTLGNPSILDYNELITSVIPEPIIKLVPLAELERRCEEVNQTMPRFREETPVLLKIEKKRRELLASSPLERA